VTIVSGFPQAHKESRLSFADILRAPSKETNDNILGKTSSMHALEKIIYCLLQLSDLFCISGESIWLK